MVHLFVCRNLKHPSRQLFESGDVRRLVWNTVEGHQERGSRAAELQVKLTKEGRHVAVNNVRLKIADDPMKARKDFRTVSICGVERIDPCASLLQGSTQIPFWMS